MAGSRILYFTTKGKFTSESIWKGLTTRGLSPRISIPETLSDKQQSKYESLQESFDFFDLEDDFETPFEETPAIEVNTFDAGEPDTGDDIPPLIHDDEPFYPEGDFDDSSILPDDLLDELDEVDELVYVGGSDD
jgi:hypothetical protein